MLGPMATCGELDAATPEERAAWNAGFMATLEAAHFEALQEDDRIDRKIHAMNSEWCG